TVTLEAHTPHGEPIAAVYAAAHVVSSNPPRPEIKYQIDISSDGGKNWDSLVKNWTVLRRADEPPDFWSQSLCWGRTELKEKASRVQVQFHNSGRKAYPRAEVHLVYRTPRQDQTKVTFAWNDDSGPHQQSQVVAE